MSALWASIFSALVSFFMGFIVKRWWDRARPLVVLHGFTSVTKSSEILENPDIVRDLSSRSWFMQGLTTEEASLGEMQSRYETAVVRCAHLEQAKELYPSVIEELQSATTEEEIIDAFRSMLGRTVLSDPLDIALKLEEVTIDESPERTKKPSLKVVESDKKNGCFLIVWRDAVTTFSDDLKKMPFLRDRVHRLIDPIQYLEKDKVIEALEQMPPLIERQIEIHEELRDSLKESVDGRGRWAAKVLVANYGAAPMMIWPEAVLGIQQKQSSAHFEMESYVAIEFEEPPRVRDLEGLHMLAPGDQVTLYVLTNDRQNEIPSGGVIRAHMEEQDSEGRVQLRVSRRGSVTGPTVKSEWQLFVDNVELP